MKVAIHSVIVKDRVRKEVGDLTTIMESMRKHGQLSPCVVTQDFELIAGYRRLMAAKRLGWQAIDAIVVDAESDIDRLEMELEENVLRKDFSPEELLAGYRRLESIRRPGMLRRARSFFSRVIGRLFKRRQLERPLSAYEAQTAYAPSHLTDRDEQFAMEESSI